MISTGIVRNRALYAAALFALTLIFAGCGGKSADQLLVDARKERDAGNFRNAVIHLKGALQKSPDNAEARYLLGETLNDMGDYQSAETELRRAIDLGHERAKVTIGKALLMLDKFQNVLNEVPLDAEANDAVQAEILTLRARALFGLGRNSEARELLNQALDKQSQLPDALLTLALLAAREGKTDEVPRLIERALANAPKNADAWLMKGDLARFSADQEGAMAAYRKVLEFNPENASAHVNIAGLQIEGKNFDEARKHLEQARKISPNPLRAMFMLALVDFYQEKYPAARESVSQILKVAPDHLPSVLLAGATELQLGAHEQAQKHLTRILERAPGHLFARKLLVLSLTRSGQVRRAIELLQPGLQQAPEDAQLMLIAGEVYLQSNDLSRATQYFEKAAKADPASTDARTKLGVSRLGMGDVSGALSNLESAVKLASDQGQADMALAMSYLKIRDHERALKAIEGLEQKQPNNPLTFNLKAAIYLDKNDVNMGRKQLERALELQPTYMAAARNLAELDLADKNPQAARRRFETILVKDRENVQALLALAEFAPRIGATRTEQIDWLQRARKASPDAIQPQVMLVRLYVASREVKKALEIAQQAHGLHPTNPEVLDILGTAQLAAGEKNQALTTYQRLNELLPKSPMVLYRLARAQAVNGNGELAASTLNKALALKPDLLEAQVALAELEIVSKRPQEAMKRAKQVQKQTPKSALGFALEGDVLMAQKKFPEAVKVYETAYELDKSGALVTKIHLAYTEAGKPHEGEARLMQWLKESPHDAGARLYAADVNLKEGNYQKAVEHYEVLLKMQPDNVVLLNNLAFAYHQLKDGRALAMAERAYKLQPEDPVIADTLGSMLVEQGNTKRGLELLQKAVTAAPKAAEIRYHLAQAHVKAGDRAKARQELEKLLGDFPDSRYAKEANQLLSDLKR